MSSGLYADKRIQAPPAVITGSLQIGQGLYGRGKKGNGLDVEKPQKGIKSYGQKYANDKPRGNQTGFEYTDPRIYTMPAWGDPVRKVNANAGLPNNNEKRGKPAGENRVNNNTAYSRVGYGKK